MSEADYNEALLAAAEKRKSKREWMRAKRASDPDYCDRELEQQRARDRAKAEAKIAKRKNGNPDERAPTSCEPPGMRIL